MNKTSNITNMAITRKDFLKTLGGLAALTIIPRRVLGGAGHIAPNDQLTKGIIYVSEAMALPIEQNDLIAL